MSDRIKYVLELTQHEAEVLVGVTLASEWDGPRGEVMQRITVALETVGLDGYENSADIFGAGFEENH